MSHTTTRRKKSSRPAASGRTLARQADKYDLYQRSVQEAEAEVRFFDRVYRHYFKAKPRILREDFCGTFAVCCEWAKKPGRIAHGVDLDPEPLNWGISHNLSKLSDAARERVYLHQADVRLVSKVKVDVLAAENFSYWIFKTREELLRYFRIAYRNLADQGVMVLDMMGGGECYVEDHRDIRKCDGFEYIWEQHRFDPITHDATFFIHFRFKDGSRIKRAFRYDWRFWTIPEVRELLTEAGFEQVDVYWEGSTEKGEGDGIFRRRKSAESDPSWIAYLAAVKR